MSEAPQEGTHDVRRSTQTPEHDARGLVTRLVVAAGILLVCITAQTILFAHQIETNLPLYIALYVAALVAFGVSARLVTRILGAVSFAADSLLNLARPAESSEEPQDVNVQEEERRDPVGRLLTASSQITTKIQAAAGEIERLKEIDPVTGLGNRWWLQYRAKQEFARAQRESSPISMVIVKIDRFDDINATFGHHAGNSALLSVADTLRDFVRAYDLIGRIAGDAFGVVLPGADLKSAADIAERLQRAIGTRTLALLGDQSVSASVSVVEREEAKDVWFEQFFERGNMEFRTSAKPD